MMVAARRALATARGAIVDLSASGAASTGAALIEVASELRDRYAVAVDVAIKSDANLPAADREEVVRIAREAILNSIRHGGAKRVEVTFDGRRSEPLLRVLDDGCGIGGDRTEDSHGFGLPTMRVRAESLGGELVTRPNPTGGTVLEVMLS
jgi:signal transduction histidine kinase